MITHAPDVDCRTVSPVYAFLTHPSMVDFPDENAAVFFVSGCNFRCGYCHNAGLLAARREGLSWSRLRRACRQFGGDWVRGAVITGGEPTLHEELDDLVAFLKDEGFRVKLDTNGSRPEVLARLLPHLDYVAMDIKAPLEDYPEFTGFSDTERIAESVERLRDHDGDYEFRTTVIEGIHTDERMCAIGELIRGARRQVLQPFLPRADLPDGRCRTRPRTSHTRLLEVARLLEGTARQIVVRG